MNILNAILSGLAGTLIMTALMYMAPAMRMPKSLTIPTTRAPHNLVY